METVAPRNEVKKFYVKGKNFWISRHDACALYKALGGSPYLSKSVTKRLRKGLWDEILKPLYHYKVPCASCKSMLDIVKDKKMTIEQLTKESGVNGRVIICAQCYAEDDEK